ncbi:MAG: glycosyltransferase family 2 protein [Alphaproteobacteria bacterium]|nr:glycosyltransferase family 2 protein [Alphaproteobacteria bacterium]
MAKTSSLDISVDYRSPGLVPAGVAYVVTLPTFRRPEQLVQTLTSLAKQTFAKPFAVVVIENDADGMAGARAAGKFFDEAPIPGLVVIAHQRGNCHAYNAGWHVTLQTFPDLEAIAVIDDDELADEAWLENLVRARSRFDADVVGAPQIPVFENKDHEKLALHPVFMPAYDVSGRVPILYSSGNVLITRRVLDALPEPFLEPAFNFIGGGDSDFYSRARLLGFCFAWCSEAPVFEAVPERRTTSKWLSARSQREGAISALIEMRRSPGFAGRMRIFAKSLVLLGLAPIRSLLLWMRTGSAAIGRYFLHVAVGRLIAEFGQINEQYRNPEVN